DLSGQYMTRNNPGTGTGTIFNAITLFPVHHIPMEYSDGTASDHALSAGDRYNPYNLLNHTGYQKRWDAKLQTTVVIDQKLDFITKGLSVKGSLSFDANQSSVTKRTKKIQSFYASGRDEFGKLIKKERENGSSLSNPTKGSIDGSKKIYLEASLNYKRTFNDLHDVTGLFLFNQKEEQFQNASGLGLLPYRKQNVVARATYGYDSRYMIEASIGATGSENFKKGHQWGAFPAIGAAWYVSNERFMKSVDNYLSKLKLRVSYGITGNDQIGASNRFPYRESLSTGGGHNLGLKPGVGGGASDAYGGGTVYENIFAAPGLTWETESKTNIGLDLGLFNNKIDIAVDWFYNRREDILIQRRTIPSAAGFRKNPFQNFGITTNSGVDASLVLHHDIGDLKLSSRSTFTYAKNKVKEYDEIPQVYDYQYYTGNSIGTPFLYIADGLYTPDDFNTSVAPNGDIIYSLKEGLPRPAAAANLAPGDIKYRDLNGDGIIDSYDKTYKHGIYSGQPKIVYGFGLNAEYKGFFGGIFFQGVGKAHVNLLSKVQNFIPFANGVDNSSARRESLDRWTAANPYNQNVTYPRMRTSKFPHNLESSTWWYRSGSFLRLKNVEFGYQFNKKLIKKLGMQNLRLYVQGVNVGLWDHIKYWDPELGGGSSGAVYPITGTWTIGLDVTF
ncbi:MAG: SusC/RagA family TonB-linked outer membrane protein, partial [Bacteroides sp.]